MLGDGGRRAAFFTGAETPSQRTRSIVDFHDNPRVSVMFLSDAGGVGLNLQRAASACINLELPWNPAVLEQRIGRIYRLGQKQPIDVYNLVSEYGIESRIAELIGVKQALFAGLFDGTNDEIRFDAAASFLTRIERLVDPGPLREAPRKPEMPEEGDEDDEPASLASEAAIADALPQTNDPPLVAASNGDRNDAANAGGSAAALFEGLRVERTADGGVRIEAAPGAAETLVALFEGMAKLVAQARRAA